MSTGADVAKRAARNATKRAILKTAQAHRNDGTPLTPGETGHASEAAQSDGSGGGAVDAVLGALGAGFAKALEIEKLVSSPIAAIPFPGLPAARLFDLACGIPHAHKHWPNIPPPVPLPFPTMGPIIPIPYVSGADKTSINGTKAARCGDMGLSVWCGGYVPVIDVYTGSASVWIEGARAARAGDITKHCQMADTAIGLPYGAILSGSGNVFIGGAPMPSLTALAMEGAMKAIGVVAKGAAHGVSELFEKSASKGAAKEANLLDRYLAHVTIGGDEAFKAAVKEDLRKMASVEVTRSKMAAIIESGHPLHIEPCGPGHLTPECVPASWDGYASYRPDPSGGWKALCDHPNGVRKGERVVEDAAGKGCGSTIYYDPAGFPNAKAPGTTSDTVLAHETNHAANAAQGKMANTVEDAVDPQWNADWSNPEEHQTVGVENEYRKAHGYPPRSNYRTMP